jgi:hypothetical protein
MMPAPETIVETYYVAPVYTGIIVMNPPEKKPPKRKKPPLEEQTLRVPRHDPDDQSIPESGDNSRRAR